MLAIDHIVIVAHDPEEAAIEFGKEHDITVMEGGKHANWGTYNYLAYFSNDSYIEWIGIFDAKIARRSKNPLIKQVVSAREDNAEGPIQYALRTDKMDNYIEHLQKMNIPIIGPVPGSRIRPDNSMLEWRMLFPESDELSLPFLIEWGDVKNVPLDSRLINKQQIHTISSNTTDLKKFTDIYRMKIKNNLLQLDNTQIITSNHLTFSVK